MKGNRKRKSPAAPEPVPACVVIHRLGVLFDTLAERARTTNSGYGYHESPLKVVYLAFRATGNVLKRESQRLKELEKSPKSFRRPVSAAWLRKNVSPLVAGILIPEMHKLMGAFDGLGADTTVADVLRCPSLFTINGLGRVSLKKFTELAAKLEGREL